PRRTHSSTPLPYTTLFRSPIQNTKLTIGNPHAAGMLLPHTPTPVRNRYPISTNSTFIHAKLMPNAIHQPSGGLPSVIRETFSVRSEEHTSELQSRFDLVCR